MEPVMRPSATAASNSAGLPCSSAASPSGIPSLRSGGASGQMGSSGTPGVSARQRVKQQIADNLAGMVFHLGTPLKRPTQAEYLKLASDIEKQAFDKVVHLLRSGSQCSSATLYAEAASTLMISEIQKLLQPAPQPSRLSKPLPVGDIGESPARRPANLAPLRTRGLTATGGPFESPVNSARAQPLVFGWLEPGTRVLPYVILRNETVIIGRGKEAYEKGSSFPSGVGTKLNNSRTLPEGRFVEVADGRVSRIHCAVRQDKGSHGPPLSWIEDWSSNGTYVNGTKIGADGEPVALKDGDRISLVLSVAPLIEQFFIYHSGDPSKKLDPEDSLEWLNQALSSTPRDGRRSLSRMSSNRSPAGQLYKTATSRYNTKEWTTLDDLQCQICLSVLTQCVALVPCGHNFCATCLSQHFGSLLQGGMPLTCPLRCATPERVVANQAVRQLVGMHDPLESPDTAVSSSRGASAGGDLGAVSDVNSPVVSTPQSRKFSAIDDEEPDLEMNVLCPLYDHLLPMDASSLKSKQVDVSLDQLRYGDDPNNLMAALEALARLSWSDDEIREEVARAQGIEAMVSTIRRFPDKEGIQCNGCLALMSLVRGEGEVCQANQWRVAKAGGVEVVVEAMECFSDHAMVQLSALLCMIPLALDNPMMQAHVAALALPAVCTAMELHPTEAEVQAKGMVVLGCLAQGDDSVHDAIRYRQLRVNAPKLICIALEEYGGGNEEVLWAALFSLAVLVREGGQPFEPASAQATKIGTHKLVRAALDEYRGRRHEEGMADADMEEDTILKAGKFLLEVLEPVAAEQQKQRYRIAAMTAASVALPCSLYLGYRLLTASSRQQ
mmetsp:Transcript_10088/g.28969  ORF Transcript_10088/g.28969 Transcript_10088/m.28969 type:complete len:837 (-) Transcript_10088:38-2548(-)